MFPVFAVLLMILRKVSQCSYPTVKQPRNDHRVKLCCENCRFEFRLLQSQIDPKGFVANSPCHLLELIRHIPTGAQHQPIGMFVYIENLFAKSVLHMCVCSLAFSQRSKALSLP